MKRRGKKETAAFIKGVRASLRLTQQELANRIDVKRYNIAKYETGATTPPGDVVLEIIRLMESNSIEL